MPALGAAGVAGVERTGVGSRLPRPETLVAERSRGELLHSSLVRTSAQLRAKLESSRARVPYGIGVQISLSPVMRADALLSKSTRPLVAYGCRWPLTGTPRPYLNDEVPDSNIRTDLQARDTLHRDNRYIRMFRLIHTVWRTQECRRPPYVKPHYRA